MADKSKVFSHELQFNATHIYQAQEKYTIYIRIANALDETIILVAVYFSMQNIYQSSDLVRTVRRSNVDVSQ